MENEKIESKIRFKEDIIILRVSLICENDTKEWGRFVENKNIYLSDCFFSRSSLFHGDGGIIFVNIGSLSLNLSKSVFYNCSCDSAAGAIYFRSTTSYLNMICSYKCTSCWCHFEYIYSSFLCQIAYLSVAYCSHSTIGNYPACVESGNQRIGNINSSMNKAFEGSGIGIIKPSSFISSHCTYSNNYVSDSICIYCSSNPGTLSFYNIVHNNSPSKYAIIYISGGESPKMMYCLFHNNRHCLFCIMSGSLDVQHSFIDHNETFSTSKSVLIATNNTFTKKNSYIISFFNTHLCNTDIPQNAPNFNTIDLKQIRSYSILSLAVLLIID